MPSTVESPEAGVTIEEIVDEEIVRDIKTAMEFKEEGNKLVSIPRVTSRLYKKGDFAAAIQSYKMSIRHCPLDDEYNKDRVGLYRV